MPTSQKFTCHLWAWLLAGCAGGLVVVWVALASVGAGHFSPLLALAAGFITKLGVAAFLIRRSATLPRWRLPDTAAAIIALSTLAATLPPAEMILGGWDPGVYLHTAGQIADQKSLHFDHPDLLAIPETDQDLFIRPLHGPGGIPEPFGGMRILPNGKVSPQFYHAYPALMAIPATWFGVHGSLLVNPLLGVLAIFAFYTLVSMWTGSRSWGLAGAALLALHPAQVWQARFSTAEMLTQLLLVTGFALLLRWSNKPRERPLEALLGGMALGLAQLTRYDTLVALAIAVPLLLWSATDRTYRTGLILALGALSAAALHVWLHQTYVAPYYQPLGPIVGQALVLCAVGTLAGWAIIATVWGKTILRHAYKPTLFLISLGWAGWMSFNLWIRPTLHQRTNFILKLEVFMTSLSVGDLYPVLVGPEGRAMLFLQSSFGQLGLVLALVGALVLLWTARTPVTRAWTGAGMAVTLLLTWNPYNDLFMMWVSRRYIPVVIPFLLLALIALAALVANRAPRIRIVPTLLVILVGAFILPSTVFLAKHRDWPGLHAWFANVNDHLPDHAVIYTDQAGFAAPLRFLWNHRAYELHFVNPQRRAIFHDTLDQAAKRHPEIFVLTQFPPDDLDTRPTLWQSILHAPMSTHILEHTPYPIPDRLRGRGGDFHLYRLTGSVQSSVVSVQENPNRNRHPPLPSPPEH